MIKSGVSPEDGVWEEAKRILKAKIDAGQALQDKIASYQNSRKPASMYPREPGPPRIYVNKHKGRKPRTKQQIYDSFQRWSSSEAFNNLVNNEDLDRHDD